MVELIISAGLLVMLLGGLTVAEVTFGKINRRQFAAAQCQAAAQAQMQSFITRGEGLAPADAGRLWPGVRLSIEQSPGQGQWAGTKLLRAVAATEIDGHQVQAVLSRYWKKGGTAK